MCDKGEGGGANSQEHISQKFAAGPVKVTTSHKEQTSPQRILVLFYLGGVARIGFNEFFPKNI